MEVGKGILGVIVLALDIWAVLNVVTSNSDMLKKVLWIVGIILVPIMGFIAWLIFGPRKA